jgi:hypothetical protein
MKKKVLVAMLFLLAVIKVNSIAADVGDGYGTISTLFVQPTLSNIGGYNGYIFVTLSDGSHFYIAPGEVTYELEYSMLLTAKSKGQSVMVGLAPTTGPLLGTDIPLGTPATLYHQIYYMSLN